MSSYPASGLALQTPFTISLNITVPLPASGSLQLLFCYIPVTLAGWAPALYSPTGYPQVTSDLEVAFAYQQIDVVDLDSCLNNSGGGTTGTGNNTSWLSECVQMFSLTTFLPPGLFQFVVHVMSNVSGTSTSVADVYYSGVPAVVGKAGLLGTGVGNAEVCGLLASNGSSTNSTSSSSSAVESLMQASLAATITSTLTAVYGASGLTADASQLSCGSSNATYATTNATTSNTTVADLLLAAMLRAVDDMAASSSPLAIDSVNSLSAATYSIVSALTANNTLASSSASSQQQWR